MAKTFDPKVYALAEAFLREEETESATVYREACNSLAGHIQDAIEDWFSTLGDIQKYGAAVALEKRERKLSGASDLAEMFPFASRHRMTD